MTAALQVFLRDAHAALAPRLAVAKNSQEAEPFRYTLSTLAMLQASYEKDAAGDKDARMAGSLKALFAIPPAQALLAIHPMASRFEDAVRSLEASSSLSWLPWLGGAVAVGAVLWLLSSRPSADESEPEPPPAVVKKESQTP